MREGPPYPPAHAGAQPERRATDVTRTMTFVKPCVDMLSFRGAPQLGSEEARRVKSNVELAMAMESHDIEILDARNRDTAYDQQGFKLVPFTSEAADVTTPDGQVIFEAELEALIRAEHPEAKKVSFIPFLTRGGDVANPPALNALHLDWFQDDAARNAFNGHETVEEDGLRLHRMIGVWKPINMHTPVYDYPLFFLDASTFRAEHEVPMQQWFEHEVDGEMEAVKNLGAHLRHDPGHRYFYFSDMTTHELVLFHHYSADRLFANVHGAFFQEGLPAGHDTRRSIEGRVLIWV